MRISYLIFLSFLFILFLFAFTTYINFKRSEEVKQHSEYVENSSNIVRLSSRFNRNILNMFNHLRGYLISEQEYFVQAYDSSAVENEQILLELRELISDTSIQQESLNQIIKLNNQWIDEFGYPLMKAKTVSTSSDSSAAAYNKLYREKILTGAERDLNELLQQKFREFSNYEYDRRTARIEQLSKSAQRTTDLSFYITILSIVVGVLVAGFLAYGISTRIMKMVKMADSIAEGNYHVYMNDKGKDEISRLARALNHMAKVLDHNFDLLKRKNAELDDYAHIVSHDMKGPLRGIDNVISWIEEDHGHELSPKVAGYLDMMKGRVKRGEHLIEGILSYARVGKEELHNEEVDVKTLIEEISESTNTKPGIKVVPHDNLPVIYTERVPLMQVFSNLISNAIKYHDKLKGTVRVYHRDMGAYYEFFVEDDGPGISRAYHDKIFKIFQTLHDRDSIESTGVGLAIVKKILEARGENIDLKSENGKGSIFSFTWTKD